MSAIYNAISQRLLFAGILSGLGLAGAACIAAAFFEGNLKFLNLSFVFLILLAAGAGLFINLKRLNQLNEISEARRKLMEDRLSSVQNTIQDGLIVMTEQGEIISCNVPAQKIFGYESVDLKGKDITMLMPRKEAEKHPDYVKRYLNTGERHIIGRGRVVTGKKSNASEFPVFLTVNEFPSGNDDNNKVFVGVLRDLSRLSQSEAKVEELSRRLLAIQEQERTQLSALIHDEVGQMLFAMKLSLQSLFADLRASKEVNRETMDQILEYMTQTIEEVRSISHSISPIRLKSLGLARAIAELAENLTNKGSAKITTYIDHIDNFFQDGWDINVYRIVQEALLNAIKHASAKSIKILSRIDQEYLYIEIEDDGCGFRPDDHSARDGLGLSLMKQRALLLDGDLSVQSNYETGTRIVLTISREVLV